MAYYAQNIFLMALYTQILLMTYHAQIIQTQIKLTLPYPYKGQFYEDTQIEYCSTVIHTNKYNYV